MQQVTVYRSDDSLSPGAVDNISKTSLTRDWYGNALRVNLSYSLVVDPDCIYFSFRGTAPAWFDSNLKMGDFVEGLWKQDVAEFFLCDDESEAYQEFNLAPSGAWWSQIFSTYRQEDPENFFMPEGVHTEATSTVDSWSASLSIPRAELSVHCSFSEKSRLNVCSIVGSDPRSYLSVCELSPKEPDFHGAAEFRAISVVPLV